MTTRLEKGWPFTVQVDDTSGAIADQVKCIDWRGRRAVVKSKLDDAMLQRIITTFSRIILPPS
jgi:hypothetical protein